MGYYYKRSHCATNCQEGWSLPLTRQTEGQSVLTKAILKCSLRLQTPYTERGQRICEICLFYTILQSVTNSLGNLCSLKSRQLATQRLYRKLGVLETTIALNNNQSPVSSAKITVKFPESCHGPDGWLPASHREGTGSIPGQSIADFWSIKWQWDRVVFDFPLSVPFYHCPILIQSSPTLYNNLSN